MSQVLCMMHVQLHLDLKNPVTRQVNLIKMQNFQVEVKTAYNLNPTRPAQTHKAIGQRSIFQLIQRHTEPLFVSSLSLFFLFNIFFLTSIESHQQTRNLASS